jgi:hypothetical protein
MLINCVRDATNQLNRKMDQPLLSDDGFELFTNDLVTFIREVGLGLRGREFRKRYANMYSRAVEYAQARPPGNRSVQLYELGLRIASRYLDDIELSTASPVMLKGAEAALRALQKTLVYIENYHVKYGNLLSLEHCFDGMIAQKKSEYCEEFGCSIDELNSQIESASYIAPEVQNQPVPTGGVPTGVLELDLETGTFNVEQPIIERYCHVIGSGLGGLVYGLAIIGSTVLANRNNNLFAVALLGISRAFWFTVIGANQGTPRSKHSISKILADTSVLDAVLLHSVLYLTGISFGIFWALYQGPPASTGLSFVVVVSFFGILVCPIGLDDVDGDVKRRMQTIHWIMVKFYGVGFLLFGIVNWVKWHGSEKAGGILSGLSFMVFGVLNIKGIRERLPPRLRVLGERRIWFEFASLELVLIVTFWTLSGAVP